MNRLLASCVVCSATWASCTEAFAQREGNPRDCKPIRIPEGCTVALPTVRSDVFTVERAVVESKVEYEGWNSSDACNCAYIPCRERVECPPVSRSRSWTLEVCINVGASLEAEFRGGLVAALLADVGATVALEVGASGCYTFGETITWTLPRSDCFRMMYRIYSTRVTSTRDWKLVNTVCTFQIDCTGQESRAQVTESGVTSGKGSATTRSGFGDQIAPRPVECGGPTFPPPGEDPYEGVRSEPCTAGICPPPEFPQLPTCGCFERK